MPGLVPSQTSVGFVDHGLRDDPFFPAPLSPGFAMPQAISQRPFEIGALGPPSGGELAHGTLALAVQQLFGDALEGEMPGLAPSLVPLFASFAPLEATAGEFHFALGIERVLTQTVGLDLSADPGLQLHSANHVFTAELVGVPAVSGQPQTKDTILGSGQAIGANAAPIVGQAVIGIGPAAGQGSAPGRFGAPDASASTPTVAAEHHVDRPSPSYAVAIQQTAAESDVTRPGARTEMLASHDSDGMDTPARPVTDILNADFSSLATSIQDFFDRMEQLGSKLSARQVGMLYGPGVLALAAAAAAEIARRQLREEPARSRGRDRLPQFNRAIA
jgi:hypothetical protein